MNALIVDDEYMASEYLRELIRTECNQFETVYAVQSAEEALKKIRASSIDLLFLDIEMPEMTGFEMIEVIGLENLPPVIFTTAFSEYALKAIKVSAVDYLLKPIDPRELVAAVEKAQKQSKQNTLNQLSQLLSVSNEDENHRIVIADGSDYFLIDSSEIIHIEGSGCYSTFTLESGRKLTSSRPLNYYYTKLESKHFIRPHQSHVVNLRWIERYSKADGGMIHLKNSDCLPVSSRLKKKVQKALGLIQS